MNILVIYATNTGNTYLTAQIIKEILGKNHQVRMKNVNDAKPSDLDDQDLVLLGSSSWDWQGKEGHPIHSMMDFLESLKKKDLSNYHFVLFGTGDSAFRVFCGAVTHLEDFVKENGGEIVFESLKVDKFYIDILSKVEQVKAWANDLNQSLNS